MLPEAQNEPTSLGKSKRGLGITGLIRGDLVRPEPGIGFGGLMMSRTAVPEASVYEDGDASTAEQQVGRATEVSLRSSGDPVTEARSMHQSAHLHLGFRVPPAVGLHGRPRFWAARP